MYVHAVVHVETDMHCIQMGIRSRMDSHVTVHLHVRFYLRRCFGFREGRGGLMPDRNYLHLPMRFAVDSSLKHIREAFRIIIQLP